jgi:DNA-binding NtrC family response regulator
MSRKLRVLIVDDEVLLADYVAAVVKDDGHEVVGTAMTADEAMGLALAHRPDLAILDIRLKGEVDGIELAVSMRATGLDLPHIFVTGSGDPETRARAEATRPLAFLQKPFNDVRLLGLLAEVARNGQTA